MSSIQIPLPKLVPEYIQRFEPYSPSKPDPELMRMFGVTQLYRLNNNENTLGPPPSASLAIEQFESGRAAQYPSGDSYYLRQALADRFGKDPDQFLVGNGSTELITSVIKAFCQSGDNVVTADRTFAVYEWVAEFSGLNARLVPLKDFGFDPEAMLEAIDERTKILFVCNPNNPTGTWWNWETMTRFLDHVAGQQIVVLDEAYCEYVENEDFPDGMQLLERYPNVVLFRTFSKMYGLAALRIGYLCGSPEVVDIIRRASIVYSVNAVAQIAAVAALDDDAEHIRATRAMVRESRAFLCQALSDLGLEWQTGEGNYLMFRVPQSDSLMYRRLLKTGYVVRTMTGFRFPNWLRVSLVQKPVLEGFAEALAGIVKK